MPSNTLSNDALSHKPDHKRKPKGPLPVQKVILTRKFHNTVYELAVRTNTDAVFDAKYKYTVTEMLEDITNALITNFQNIAKVSEAFNALMEGCPEEFNTLKEIADYINVNGDPKSELIELIDNKVDKIEGKGLSTHDLTDVLYDKLVNGYTKEELDEKFEIITDELGNIKTNIIEVEDRVQALEEKTNVEIGDAPAETVKDNDIWFKLHSEYVPQD